MVKAYRVWDHMPENVDALQKMGVQALAAVPIGYAPALSRVKQLPEGEQDIACMFVGTVSDHRLQIIYALQKAGFRVEPPPGRQIEGLPKDAPLAVIRGGDNFLYGAERDKLLARTKVVLNPQLHPESKEFKWVRLFYLLANNKFILSEPSETPEEAHYRDGMAFAAADDFPKAILSYLKNETGRKAVARRGMHEFQRHSSGATVKPAIEEFIRRHCKVHKAAPPLGLLKV